MGKKGKQSSAAAKKAPKCACEHAFKCDCGNRPERPSRGHKWDPEEQKWGGKGHKQKGGSGQTSQVATAAKTTEKGQTVLAQWQKLPSSLLADICKKEKRPPAKYKSLSTHGGGFKFRVIVQDAKVARRGGAHDIILMPASNVPNEEQAKEEAALLALLHLSPSIPHERKLPEPYKSTWLNALQAQKEAQSKPKAKSDRSSAQPGETKQTPTSSSANKSSSENKMKPSTATASSNLVNANTYTSLQEKRKQSDEKRKARNGKIRRHEAIRQANRDVQIFMSAQIRKQIESLLRGDADNELRDSLNVDDGDDLGDDVVDEEDVVMSYVVQRLVHEGFTKTQAKAGYSAVLKNPSTALQSTIDSDEDQYMDLFYEESLQWLCVHLNEDQLPEGFDPRGRTLDVIVTAKPLGSTGQKPGSKSKSNGDDGISKEVKEIARELGVSLDEAKCLSNGDGENDVKADFWNALCQLNNVDSNMFVPPAVLNESETESNQAIALEEVEVLKAIFPEEEDMKLTTFTDLQNQSVTQLLFPLNSENDDNHIMCVQFYSGSYPTTHPKVFIIGGWITGDSVGTALHSAIIKFISELPNDEPMVFEVFNYAQELLQSLDTIKSDHKNSILPFLNGGEKLIEQKKSKANARNETKRNHQSTGSKRKAHRSAGFRSRPRPRSAFWSKLPKDTPPAEAFPKLGTLIGNARKRLPAAAARDEFLSVMDEADSRDRVLLVTGETGCGKTTQIPQFILEEAPKYEKIIVAQPRRLAATGVAGRVANERGEKQPGTGSVGYVVRGDSKICNHTRLLFCTTGVLLRQLQSEGALDCITTIVIDEVHERHLDTDILLAILKETRPKHLRVVLMSATMDADRFAAYWGKNTPRMHIPGFTHPVKDFSLGDVLSLTGYIPPKKGKKKARFYGGNNNNKFQRKKTAWNDSEVSDDEDQEESVNPAGLVKSKPSELSHNSTFSSVPIEDLVKRVSNSEIDYDLLAILIDKLITTKKRDDDGSILVFLPGAPEIAKAKTTITKITGGQNMRILPLHGGLTPADQNRVFDDSPYGITKVILSTNVAETSITIPDCTVVVDTCKEKQSSYDPSNRMPLLIEKLASRDSLRQRRGRAGRVRPGCCYKLISSETHSKLPQHGEPEIKRCALDQTLLSLLFIGVETGSGSFLSKLIDPPSLASIDAAVFSLEKIGAILLSKAGEERRMNLTPLGQHLAGIPAPPMVGKMLVMGSLMGCRSAALAVAAGLSTGKSPFLRIDYPPRHNQEESQEDYRNKLITEERKNIFEKVGNSDHAVLAAVFTEWDSLAGGGGSKRKYLETLGLSPNGMRDMKQLVKQLGSSLASAGFHETSTSDINGNSWRIIRSFIVSALAPTQIARVHRATTKYAETSEGAVEKDGIAKELKFYTRGADDSEDEGTKHIMKFYHGVPEERVFVHPSSANFSVGNYSCPWLVYYQLVRTSKPFMRDLTECSNYDLLLFGGKIEVIAAEGLIVVDNYVRMSANARIAALIGGLRRKVDDLLSKKISDPSYDVVNSLEMKLIVKLLRTDGMGQ